MSDERENLLHGVLKIKQPNDNEGPRVNVDTILLAHFVKPRHREKILEIGCAHGAISLILAKRGYNVTGLDIQPHLITMARENAMYNGLSDRLSFIAGDLKDYKKLWAAQSFDRIVVNPPYDEPENSKRSPSDAIATAMQVNLSMVAIEESEVNKRLAAWAGIFGVATAFAGIWGMNFTHMPELNWEYGYPAALSLIAGSCGYLYWRFRRAGWL